MATAPAWAPQPCNEWGRLAGRPAVFVNNSDSVDTPDSDLAQRAFVPPIIALHWLRPEPMEANDA